MTRKSKLLVSISALSAILVVTSAYALKGPPPVPPIDQPGLEDRAVALPLDTVSSRGIPSGALGNRDTTLLDKLELSGAQPRSVQRIQTSGGQSYYRIANAAGSDCFGIGSADRAPSTLAQVVCQKEFPSRAFPLIDMTVAGPDGSIIRSEGFVADGIATMRIETIDGSTVAETPVVNNVYHFPDTAKLDAGKKLIGLTADDEIVSVSDLP
jgi:hypothetical protein